MTKLSTQGRIRLLTTASAAVAAVALSQPALAGETTVTPVSPISASTVVSNAQDNLDSNQNNSGDVSAPVGPTVDGVSGVATSNDTVLVDSESKQANAFGNTVDNSISTYKGIQASDPGDGAAALGAQINTGEIDATATSNVIGASLQDFTTGSVDVTNNTIGADGSGNVATTTLSGDIPTGYVSVTAGYSDIATTSPWLDAEGGLVASTLQLNDSDLVDALANGNTIGLELTSTADNKVDANPTLDDNSISGAAKGNASDSTIEIAAGGAPTFGGTAVVSNAQTNTSSTSSPHAITGAASGNEIIAVIDGDTGFVDTLIGGLSVSGNAITSSASGNEALGNGVSGNRILLGDTMSFEGLAIVPAVTDIKYNSGSLTQSVDADLVINSAQGNVGANNGAGRMDIQANTQGNEIGAGIQAIDGGSVAIDGNSATATASGNAASSGFATGTSVNTFDGSLAVANQQTNLYTDIAATNSANDIGGEIVDNGQTELPDSSVTVDGNRVAASAYGSQSDQGITLDAGTTTLPGTAVNLGGGLAPDGHLYAEGGATVSNLQSLYSSGVSATQEFSHVGIVTGAELVTGSSLETISNTQEALARGNSGTNRVSLSGNTVGGSVGAVNTQIAADDFSVSAISVVSTIGIETNDVAGSTFDVKGNRQAATAYANSVTQTVSVAGNTVDLAATGVSLHGGIDPDASDDNVSVDANVGLANLQFIQGNGTDNVVSATVTESDPPQVIGITADNVAGSTLSVTSTAGGARNTQEAIAIGNSGTNGLSLSGNTVGTGGGLASVQVADGVSIEATNSPTGIGIDAFDITGSTLEVSNNLQRSLAYGGSVSNALSVDATSVVVNDGISGVASTVNYDALDPNGFVLDGAAGSQPEVLAAYGLLNVQTTHALIDATMVGEEPLYLFTDSVTGSTLINDTNDYVAAAYGNDATNTASLTGSTNVSTDVASSYAAVMNLTSAQTLASNDVYTSSVSAQASVYAGATDGSVVSTYVDGTVSASSVSTSGNVVQALANGNQVSNTVSADLNNIDTETDGSFTQGFGSVVGGQASTDASFSLNNVQAAAGTISATLLNDETLPDTLSAEVRTTVTGDIVNSTVNTDGNTLTASGTANRADNLIDLAGNSLATSSSLVNYQIDPTSISATLGVEGGIQNVQVDPGVPAVNAHVAGDAGSTGSPTFIDYTGSAIQVSSNLVLDVGTVAFTQAEADYLNSLNYVSGATVGGHTITLESGGTIPTSLFNGFIFNAGGDSTANTGNESFTTAGLNIPYYAGVSPTFDDVYVPGSGGVIARILGNVDPSTVTVDNNVASGSVTGNSATNAVQVTASTLTDGNDHIFTSATTAGLDTVAAGDHMLTNVQVVTDGGDLNSVVNSTFAIDMEDASVIDDSTLSVDGNKQSARAVANTASNSVTLTVGNSLDVNADNTGAGAALASNQASEASVSATSNMAVFAPVASDNSTVSMSDNSNLAVGVINNVTNTVTVDATNAGFVSFPNNVLLDVDNTGPYDTVAFGDHVLLNKQTATTSVSGTATTDIFNDDNSAITSEGINNGSVAITGNSTNAEASANRAVNTMSVGASANLTASAGLVNNQDSSADATAAATTNAGFALTGDGTPVSAINGSTATLGSNSTTALARGNSATNALNYSAGANYGTGGGVASIQSDLTLPNATLSAQAGVLNAQNNSGEISASSNQASYLVALNSSGSPTTTNATIGVIGNTISAAAYGNTANNSITVASLNGTMPTAALGNVQNNTGSVTASVTSVTYGITTGVGAATGSTLGVNANAITATAVGNNAVNTITAR